PAPRCKTLRTSDTEAWSGWGEGQPRALLARVPLRRRHGRRQAVTCRVAGARGVGRGGRPVSKAARPDQDNGDAPALRDAPGPGRQYRCVVGGGGIRDHRDPRPRIRALAPRCRGGSRGTGAMGRGHAARFREHTVTRFTTYLLRWRWGVLLLLVGVTSGALCGVARLRIDPSNDRSR